LYLKNLSKLFLSKKVELIAVVAAEDVKVCCFFNPKLVELTILFSLKYKLLILIYLSENIEGLWIKLVVYTLEWARICLKAVEALKVSKPISLKFKRFKIRELSEGKTSRCAGETTTSSSFV